MGIKLNISIIIESMKIAIISPYAYPEHGACAKRSKSLSDYLQCRGHHVRIFAPERSGLKGSDEYTERYASLRGLLNVLFGRDFDAIIGTSPPITHPFLGMFVSRIKGVPFILDIRDPFTHSLQRRGAKTSFLKWASYTLMELLSHRLADKITAVTEYDVNLIKKSYGRDAVLAMNGTDLRINEPTKNERRQARSRFGVPEKCILLVYSGGLSREREMDMFIEHGKDVLRRKDVHLAVAVASDNSRGVAEITKELKDKVKSLGIEKKVHFMENIDDVDLLLCSDIGIDPLDNRLEYCLPVKTFDYMACHLPIAAKGPVNGELSRLIRENGVGFISETWPEFSRNLERAVDDIKNFKRLGKKGARIAAAKFTRNKSNEIILKTINRIQKNAGRNR